MKDLKAIERGKKLKVDPSLTRGNHSTASGTGKPSEDLKSHQGDLKGHVFLNTVVFLSHIHC